MVTKKPNSSVKPKKAKKKEEVIDVKVEELMPPRIKLTLFCRILVLGSFIGTSLLVYDKIEPGKIPFFAEPEKELCENPVHNVADQINEILSSFSSQLQKDLPLKNEVPELNFAEVVGSINDSKNEILESVSGYLKGIKSINLQASDKSEKKLEEAITEAKQDAAKDSKQEIVIDLVFNKVNTLLDKETVFNEIKTSFVKDLQKVKSKILSNDKAVEGANLEESESEISSKIKSAIGQFVKVRKVDEKRVMLEQLFFEVDESLDANDFGAVASVLNEIKSITKEEDIEPVVKSAEDLESLKDKNITENLKEILLLIEKLKGE